MTASCLDLVTSVWFLIGCQPETVLRRHQGAWTLTGSLFYLRLEHVTSLLTGRVKKRNGFSALCPSRPLARVFCLSLFLCLSSLAVVKVRTKRRRRSWRMMMRRRTCGVGEHLLVADGPFPFVSPVLPPSVWSSHVPFLSLSLWRVSDCSSFAAVEKESDEPCWGDFASLDFWTWTCYASLGFGTWTSWQHAHVLSPSLALSPDPFLFLSLCPCLSPYLCPSVSPFPGLTRLEEEKLSAIESGVPDTALVECDGLGRWWRFSGVENVTSWLRG